MIFKFMQKTFFICGCSLFIILCMCNYIPEFTDNSVNFIPHEDHFFKYDSLYFFNPTPGNEVYFKGIRKRTIEGQDLAPRYEEDSIYYKWTTNQKIIKEANGSTYGLFAFSKSDIYNWNRILETMKSAMTPLGEIIPDYMDKKIYDTIITQDSVGTFSSSDSNVVFNTIEKMIADGKLYSKYRGIIRNFIESDTTLLNHLNTELNILVTKSIFTDTSGMVNNSLSEKNKEELKWFNRLLLSRFSAELNFRAFIKYPVAGSQVFSVTFEQGNMFSIDKKQEMTQYYLLNNKSMQQLSYKVKNYEYVTPNLSDSASIIHNFYFNSRTQYPIAPIFFPSDIPYIEVAELPDLVIPGKVVFSLLKYSKIGDTLFYNMKIYYPLFGTIYRNDKPIDISGTITILAHFYKISLVNTGDDQGYFTDWKTDIEIRKKNIHGKVEFFRETRVLFIDKNRR